MKKYLFLLGIAVSFGVESYAQCTVEAFPADTISVWCGYPDTITLEAYGNSGNHILSNDFNSGTAGSGWQVTPAGVFNNPCGPSPDGTIHMWMGDATPQPRILTTQAFDLSVGGVICFEMRFSIQGDAAPCEGPDEPQEGVYLQYSVDNGSNWNNINYFDPLGGNDPILTSWQEYCFNIPITAQTPNTQLRWFQDATSGNEYDHWGIDNVVLTLNDPTAQYIWSHNGFNGQVPPDVIVDTDSVFTVTYFNADGDTCTDEVVVVATPPTLSASAISDITLCSTNNCIDLNGVAGVVFSPDTSLTFENNETQPIATIGVPGGAPTTAINVNVQGVNNGTIGVAEIESVCINGLTYFGFDFFSQTQLDIGDLDIQLVCPDGDTILLVPQGITVGNNITSGYTNTCFVPAGGNDIAQGSTPYTGNFEPEEPFTDLNGCSSNGVWQMLITNNGVGTFGQGVFNGWSITFHDPEISQPAVYSWGPTDYLDNPQSLNPNACPTEPITYTLTVNDSSYCATKTYDVNIDIVEMEVSVEALIVEPNCGATDGSIDVTNVIGFSGGYDISWSTGDTTAMVDNLSPGVYTLSVSGLCTFDTTFVLGGIGGPEISTVNTTPPTTELGTDGSLEVITTSGTPPYQYSLDNGNTFQSDNVFADLANGTYDVLVQDANGCVAYTTVTLDVNEPVFIPNVFNPNSSEPDNAYFTIVGMDEPEVVIYNRWGKKIFESSAYQNDWDGEKYSDGVYFYIAKDKADGQSYKGYVQLVR